MNPKDVIRGSSSLIKACALLVASILTMVTPAFAQGNEFVVRDVRIFDGTRVVANGQVWVQNGKIKAVGKDVKADLERIFGRPIPYANDANCAALAEAIEGAGRGHKSVFGLIFGTGVGGGFVLDGKIVAGANVHVRREHSRGPAGVRCGT